MLSNILSILAIATKWLNDYAEKQKQEKLRKDVQEIRDNPHSFWDSFSNYGLLNDKPSSEANKTAVKTDNE